MEEHKHTRNIPEDIRDGKSRFVRSKRRISSADFRALGIGLRGFENPGLERVRLEKINVHEVALRTILRFRVKRWLNLRGLVFILIPGVKQLHSEIPHIADIPSNQRQFMYQRSCGKECIDDRS